METRLNKDNGERSDDTLSLVLRQHPLYILAYVNLCVLARSSLDVYHVNLATAIRASVGSLMTTACRPYAVLSITEEEDAQVGSSL